MDYRVTGLDPTPFIPLYGRDETFLASVGVRRMSVDRTPGFPDRIGLREMAPGESALLLNFEHQPADTPFRSRHAVYIAEGAESPAVHDGELPPMLRSRVLSLRAFDADGMMTDAAVLDGEMAEAAVLRLLDNPACAYVHAHFAARGCFAARIDRL
jgi:hypothetical protein